MLESRKQAHLVNKLVAIKQRMDRLKLEKEEIEASLIAMATEALDNSKEKSILYYGKNGESVTATLANNVKLIYPSYLKKIFGDAYQDVVKEEPKYTLNEPSKRLLAGLYKDEYTKMTIVELIDGINVTADVKKALKKKIRGINPETDKKNFISLAGMSEADAGHYAYFAAEAQVWESLNKLLTVNEKMEIDPVIELIKGAVLVEETLKLTLVEGGS